MGLWFNHLLESGEYERIYNKNKYETKDMVGSKRSGARVEKSELFSHYIEWSRQNKLRLVISPVFWTRMKQKFGFTKTERTRDGDVRKYTVVMPTVEEVTNMYNITHGLKGVTDETTQEG
jgi:L-rhamnose isomerase